MLSRLRHLFAPTHRCLLPRPPVTEDQRYWTCPDCGRRWGWYSMDNGFGRLVDDWVLDDEKWLSR